MRSKLNNQQHSFPYFLWRQCFIYKTQCELLAPDKESLSSIDSGCQTQLKERSVLECNLSDCLVQTCMSDVKPV